MAIARIARSRVVESSALDTNSVQVRSPCQLLSGAVDFVGAVVV